MQHCSMSARGNIREDKRFHNNMENVRTLVASDVTVTKFYCGSGKTVPISYQPFNDFLFDDQKELDDNGPEWKLWTIWGKTHSGLFDFDMKQLWRRKLLAQHLEDTLKWAVDVDVTIDASRLYIVTLVTGVKLTHNGMCNLYEIKLANFTCTTFGRHERWFMKLNSDLEELLKPSLVANETFYITGGYLDVPKRTLHLRLILDAGYNYPRLNKECKPPTLFHLIVDEAGKPKSYVAPYGTPLDTDTYECIYREGNAWGLCVTPQISDTDTDIQCFRHAESITPSEIPPAPMILEGEFDNLDETVNVHYIYPRHRCTYSQRSVSSSMTNLSQDRSDEYECAPVVTVTVSSPILKPKTVDGQSSPIPVTSNSIQVQVNIPSRTVTHGSDDSYKTAVSSQTSWPGDRDSMDEIMGQLNSQSQPGESIKDAEGNQNVKGKINESNAGYFADMNSRSSPSPVISLGDPESQDNYSMDVCSQGSQSSLLDVEGE